MCLRSHPEVRPQPDRVRCRWWWWYLRVRPAVSSMWEDHSQVSGHFGVQVSGERSWRKSQQTGDHSSLMKSEASIDDSPPSLSQIPVAPRQGAAAPGGAPAPNPRDSRRTCRTLRTSSIAPIEVRPDRPHSSHASHSSQSSHLPVAAIEVPPYPPYPPDPSHLAESCRTPSHPRKSCRSSIGEVRPHPSHGATRTSGTDAPQAHRPEIWKSRRTSAKCDHTGGT